MEFSSVDVTKLLLCSTHRITSAWTQQEKPGALTGRWPLLPLLLLQKGGSKGPGDSILGYLSGAWCWGEAVAWLPCVVLQGQWSGAAKVGIPVGPSSSARVYRSVGSGSKSTCIELSSAEWWHHPYSDDPASTGFVCHCFPLFWAGKC